ncbi:MAG: hypothetical protein E7399_01215 [Ruminococcaceae bacterium]|nr:hypothetical protein [Oscillospiraceae bacterium]
MFHETWIWLPEENYPKRQTTKYSGFLERNNVESYTVAEFEREYRFDKQISYVQLRFSGDTEFQLFCNDEFLATGPVPSGGDFIGNELPRSNFYATKTTLTPHSDTLHFFARVKMMPVKICEYSKGHGGFMLTGHICFEDGSQYIFSTDSSWNCRLNGAYCSPFHYDGRIAPDPYVSAQVIPNFWNTKTAPLAIRTEREMKTDEVIVPPHSQVEQNLEFDMIYAGFLSLKVKTKGEVRMTVTCKETEEEGSKETFVFDKDGTYRGFALHSAGKLVIRAENDSDETVWIQPVFLLTHYPVKECAITTTNDKALNRVLEVCRHTLQYCRQLHHLDSPRHCEPLACTGDYYIESLMTAVSFGDMTLAEFDVVRTAELLRNNDGRMFHTTYSLLWVLMLYEVYLFAGNKVLLEECKDALLLLLQRFETYLGENGLIETPPDYMFVDWIYIDEISMHHPPKALGQSCLNLFYFGALEKAELIFRELSESEMAIRCGKQKEALKNAINSLLYDEEKGLYFEGLNTPTPEHLLGQWMPRNTEKRYYLKHSNILAACFGVCDQTTAQELIRKIMTGECEGEYQPYFAHYLLEAIERNGLRDGYTVAVLERWKVPVSDCPKGLVEGFVAPEPTYHFDHSHAWGGTPLYSLPKALLGFKVLEAGMKRLELSPSLLGLKEARVELPTPYGMVVCDMKEGQPPVITCPKEIQIVRK